MPRYLAVIAFLTLLLSSLSAQPQGDANIPLEYFIPRPKNTFSASLRFGAHSKVVFRNLGNIPASTLPGDPTGIIDRTYNDGYVKRDARVDDNQIQTTPDGRTNTWAYNYQSQISADQGSILFHSYSVTTNGATRDAQFGPGTGWDVEYTHQFGATVPKYMTDPPRWSWGGALGFNFDHIDAKTSSAITAKLRTITDSYSLMGAAVPGWPYTSPSSTSVVVTKPDGSTYTVFANTSVLIPQQPDVRNDVTNNTGANINGFWQVRGAYYTLRLGPWIRWQPYRRLSFKGTLSLTGSWVGAKFRYDELLQMNDVLTQMESATETRVTSFAVLGYHAGAQAELWLTDRTGFIAGVDYQGYTRKITLKDGGREAELKIDSGLGARLGITTRF